MTDQGDARSTTADTKKGAPRKTHPLFLVAEWTGLEPATPGVTGRYSNQLNYHSMTWWVLRGSNPRPSPCKGDALPAELSTPKETLQFTASLRALPALNTGIDEAEILIVSPVRGFRPERAARSFTMNVPNPTKVI